MNGRDRLWITLLGALALVIWLRDRSWLQSPEDAFPLLLALPLAAWLGRPWNWKPSAPGFLHLPALVFAAFAWLLGSALNLALLLALGWTAALWAWMRPHLDLADRSRVFRLLVLAVMAFPWISLDAQSVGWWFRLSGAWSAEMVFRGLGFSVSREGTSLLVQGLPMSVEAACSGLNVLQSLLVAGTGLAYLHFARSPLYGWNLLALLPAAWLANTLRILVITAAALTWGRDFAMGLFHSWGGLVVLAGMFLVCGAIFEAERRLWDRREGTP